MLAFRTVTYCTENEETPTEALSCGWLAVEPALALDQRALDYGERWAAVGQEYKTQ